MNEKSKMIYDYVRDVASYAGTPSVRDICTALGIKSPSTVHRYLNELEKEGLITRSNDKHRYISLTQDKAVLVPIYGTIPAGQPITAVENIDGYVPVSNFRGEARELFALKVHGESMIEAGILNGDIAILRSTPTAENGQIVAAMVHEDEATLKRFYKEDGRFRLQPENSSMEPIFSDSAVILGVLVALYRDYEK